VASGTLEETREALHSGASTSRALVESSLSRARGSEERLACFTRLRGEAALAEGSQSDERRVQGDVLGPLDGVPVAIKDNMVMRGEESRCASRILEGFVSPYTSTAVERLCAAGSVVVGHTNMDEFAMGSSTEHSCFAPTRNPWDPDCTPGGSSGGSAAAVAAGLVPVALGSDTGGSIRQPASLCGVVGLKPTYGRVSRYGLIAYASSLDQIGVFARSAADAAEVLTVIAGHDPQDSTSVPEPVPTFGDALDGDVSGLVVGLPSEYFESAEGCAPEVLEAVREAVATLERAGARVCDVSLPHTRYAVPTYYLIATAEASSNLARFDGVRYGRRAEEPKDLGDMYRRSRSEGFGPEVKRRILLGTYVLSAGYYDAYYRKAQQVRTLLRRDFQRAFEQCDVLATPTAPEVAFGLGEKTDDPLRMYLSDIFTVSANLAGVPAVSLPCGFSRGLPIGLQLMGAALDESRLLKVADAYQRLSDHHVQRPPEFA